MRKITFYGKSNKRKGGSLIEVYDQMKEIAKNSGKQFDPEAVEAFRRVMKERMESA